MLAVAASAWAAATMEFGQPAPSDPYFRSTDDGNVVVRGRVTSKDPIESVSFAFDPPLGDADECSGSFVNEPGQLTVDPGEMSATFELVIAAPCNRSHAVTATVTHKDPLVLGVARPRPETSGPVRFGVAVPPAPVQDLEATYDAASKKVNLTWAPNSEPDIVGYRVEGNPPGPDGFQPIGGTVLETNFTDTLTVDEEHRYRVVAVRSGPDATIREVLGEPSDIITAGPDRPEPTVPDTTVVRAPPSASRGGSAAGGNRGGSAARPSRGSVTTVDNGFTKDLPFDPRQTTTVPASPSPVPPEDAAVLAIDDDRAQEDDRRATLVPIAGGLALMMGAVHLRLLSKRAAEPELPVYGSTLPR